MRALWRSGAPPERKGDKGDDGDDGELDGTSRGRGVLGDDGELDGTS